METTGNRVTFKPGDWVIITEEGPYLGKTGELLPCPEEHSDQADWIVLITAGGIGVGFFEQDLIPDPRKW